MTQREPRGLAPLSDLTDSQAPPYAPGAQPGMGLPEGMREAPAGTSGRRRPSTLLSPRTRNGSKNVDPYREALDRVRDLGKRAKKAKVEEPAAAILATAGYTVVRTRDEETAPRRRAPRKPARRNRRA